MLEVEFLIIHIHAFVLLWFNRIALFKGSFEAFFPEYDDRTDLVVSMIRTPTQFNINFIQTTKILVLQKSMASIIQRT